jgi:hypothetical protein
MHAFFPLIIFSLTLSHTRKSPLPLFFFYLFLRIALCINMSSLHRAVAVCYYWAPLFLAFLSVTVMPSRPVASISSRIVFFFSLSSLFHNTHHKHVGLVCCIPVLLS